MIREDVAEIKQTHRNGSREERPFLMHEIGGYPNSYTRATTTVQSGPFVPADYDTLRKYYLATWDLSEQTGDCIRKPRPQ